jgi:hypothetical protein
VKGAIFKAFEHFVVDNYGEDTWEDIYDATGLETVEPFVGPGTYPATDLLALVTTTIGALGISLDDALRAFGRHAFPGLARSVASLMEGLDDPHAFLLSLESLIHTEVRKLDPDASSARFSLVEDTPEAIVLRYESPYGLFALVEGFFDGLADWYHTTLRYELISTEGTNATFRVHFLDSNSSLVAAAQRAND